MQLATFSYAALSQELARSAELSHASQFIVIGATRRGNDCAFDERRSDDRGIVAAGKRSDLLLLEGNPLADIKNTRRIAAVIVGGKLYSRSELNARMEGLRGGSG